MFRTQYHPRLLGSILLVFTFHPQLRSQTVDGAAQTNALEATNGNKFAVGSWGRLHAVYAKQGNIYYSSTANGQTWSAGVVLTSGGASQPSIAAATDGTLGLIYKDSGDTLWYQWCKPAANKNVPCTTWSTPRFIGQGRHPSLVAFQKTMHVAYENITGTANPVYSQFIPQLNTGLTASDVEVVWDVPVGPYCAETAYFPAVTVIPAKPQPEVRVAWVTLQSSSCSYPFISVRSATRPPTKGLPVWSPGLYSYSLMPIYYWKGAPEAYSLSAAANANTGEQFIVASAKANSQEVTTIIRRGSNGVWSASTLFNQAALIDIESNGSSCIPAIRIAYTKLTSGSVYGNTYHQTGPSAGALGTPVLVSSAGTSPQASFWGGNVAGQLSFYEMPVFFAQKLSNIYEDILAPLVQTYPGASCE